MDLADRVAALEKQVAELTQEVARLGNAVPVKAAAAVPEPPKEKK